MTVEDQLRAAGRAVRDQVRDLPELHLPDSAATHQAAHRPARRTSRRYRATWLIPLTAAAAIVAIAATLVAVRDTPGTSHTSRVQPASKPSPAPSASTPPVHPADPEALPAYFAAIRYSSSNGRSPQTSMPWPGAPDSIVVGRTKTGSIVASVTPPAGTSFTGITGAADDRTFIVDSAPVDNGMINWGPHTWFLLRISPGTPHPIVLTKLAVPKTDMREIFGIAQSPDGTRFAVLYQSEQQGGGRGYPPGGTISLGIYSAVTGALQRQWSFANPYHQVFAGALTSMTLDSDFELDWTPDGKHLGFMDRFSSASIRLRVLDLASPGNALFADAKVILALKGQTSANDPSITCMNFWLSSDERSVLCGALMPQNTSTGVILAAAVQRSPWIGCSVPASGSYPGFIDVAVQSKKIFKVLYELNPACMGAGDSRLLWVSPSGQTALGQIEWNDNPSMTWHVNLVLYSHGRATPLSNAAASAIGGSAATAF